jgi:hypothetical protein
MYFGYYITKYTEADIFTSNNIRNCFNQLKLVPYSNIPTYLKRAALKKFLIKNKQGYMVERNYAERIANKIGETRAEKPSNALFPIELLNNTRDYLVKTGNQAILCYDHALYDACLVMTRRLLETLIIELFERYNIQDRIKDTSGNYFYLSDLITKLIDNKMTWAISRNSISALPTIKGLGDMSAHNRRFNARKSDIDNIKTNIRTVIEELVNLIDYKNWNSDKKTKKEH